MPSWRNAGIVPIVVATMTVAALWGCGHAVPDQRVASSQSQTVAPPRRSLALQPASRTSPAIPDSPDLLPRADVVPGPDGVNLNPDPQLRMAALEVWAGGARDSLDPVTYALVDPDEAVRTRAQELLEQELLRR